MASSDPQSRLHRPGSAQSVTIGATSVQSAVFSAGCTAVCLVGSGACRVTFGVNPTATATATLMPAGVPMGFTVSPGERLAVIQEGASTGALSVTELQA